MRLRVVVIFQLSLISAALAQTSQRPNFLVIMTDDQSHDTLTEEFMPSTKEMIADQGVTFSRFIMPTALCCPRRASFLMGKYAHHTGLRTNNDQLLGPTFVNRLHDAGYFTGLVGKTIYELAGIPIPSDIDGRSLVPLLRGSTEWRDAVLLEGWPGTMNAQTTPSEEEEEEPEADQAGNHAVQNQATAPTDQDYEAVDRKSVV